MTYAIFVSGGQQFRAEPGKTVQVPKLDVEPGAKVTFDRVLLTSDGKKVHTGAPVVKGAKVTGEVVKHGKGDKIRSFRQVAPGARTWWFSRGRPPCSRGSLYMPARSVGAICSSEA